MCHRAALGRVKCTQLGGALKYFVNYDIDGRPDGVKYKLLAVGLIGLLKNGLLDG